MKKQILVLISLCIIAIGTAQASEIHDACKAGDLNRVKQLIAKDPAQMQAKTPEGKSPLHMATGWGQKEIVIWLLQNGADINALNNNGGMPIHVAASQNQPECAAILLQSGADIEALRELGGMTPLAIAVLKDNYQAAEFFLKNGANPKVMVNGRFPLFMIAKRRASAKMNALISKYLK
mgnify:CR=1 FL=1